MFGTHYIYIIRRMVAMVVAMVAAVCVWAVPARRVMVTLAQPDGTVVMARLCGDEFCRYYIDEEGCMLTQGADGFYRKATVWEREVMQEEWQARREQRNANRLQRVASKAVNKKEEETRYIVGKKRGLVILVEFLNLKMKTPNPRAAFDAQFNEEGYSKNGHIGSVRDYFLDQSYGALDITFDVVGPVCMEHEYSYYGKNNAYGNDTHPGEMVIEACLAVDDEVNFADYDWDGDGEVEQVVVVYAGYGENAGAAKSTIWPHEYSLDDAAYDNDGTGRMLIDNTVVNTYAVSCELADNKGSRMDGIGTACHEFSHCLGLPDTYDTSGGDIDMGDLDIMSVGSYSGPTGWGEVPCGFSAYERHYAGWLDYTVLTDDCDVDDLPSIGNEPVAYIMYNDDHRNEYFTLENRQASRWFRYMGSEKSQHGLLIVHIDYDRKAWSYNTVNSTAGHPRMMYVPASNTYDTSKPVLFPGKSQVTSFTGESHKASGGKLYHPLANGSAYLNKKINNIKESNGLVSFTFTGDGIANSITSTPSSIETSRQSFAIDGRVLTSPIKGVSIVRKGEKVYKIIDR